MIRIYPSILPGEPIETHEVSGITVGEWLTANVPDYSPELPAQPITVAVGGVTLAPEAWGDANIIEGTCVEIRVLPRKSVGRALSSVISAVVKVVSSLLSWLTPSIPGQPSVRAGQQGSSIYDPSAQANAPKLGAPIPEIAGQHKVFPDYLTQPRKYFVNTTTQAVDMLLCIGKGHYSVPDAQIRIGATPIQALGQSVNYQVFEPGQSVTGHQASRRWYSAPEVGASTGSSGLRLKGLSGGDRAFTGTINVNGSLFFDAPAGWEAGLEIARAYLWQPLTILDGGDGNPDIIEGDFRHLSAGQTVRIEGISSLPDDYVITSHTDTSITLETLSGNSVANQTPDTYLASIDVAGARYLITARLDSPTGVSTDRLLPDGSPDPEWTSWPQRGEVQGELRVDPNSSPGFWSGPFLACPEGEVTSRIEFDILAPQGLGWIEDDGNIVTRNEGHDVELQWRTAGTPGWTSVIQSPTGKTRDQLGFTYAISLPAAITPEVRVRRVNAEDMATQALDKLEWLSLRSELPAATSYPGVTVIAMTITGSDTIASQTENRVSCVVTRRLEPLGGGSLAPTRSIAAWVRYVAHSIGYTDAEIDMDELARLDGIWSSRGDTFDFVHDGDGTVKEVLSRCLRCGFADLTFDDGLLTPVRDEPRSTFEQMYTPQNMTGPLQRGVTMPRPDDLDGVDVEYFDATTWTNETVECRLPGDAGFRPEKIRLEGITNRTRAWRIGMRERRRLRYARWAYRFSTEMDALNSRLLSYVALGDDVPGYGRSSLAESATSTSAGLRIQLSEEPVTGTPGEWILQSGLWADVGRWFDDAQWIDSPSQVGLVLAWRRPDGSLSGPWPVIEIDGMAVVVDAGESLTVDRRRELPHILIGTTDRWTFPALIRRIRPRGMDAVTVEAENYDGRVYADDDNAPSA